MVSSENLKKKKKKDLQLSVLALYPEPGRQQVLGKPGGLSALLHLQTEKLEQKAQGLGAPGVGRCLLGTPRPPSTVPGIDRHIVGAPYFRGVQ